MSKWITRDYKCYDCGYTDIKMLDRNNQDEPQVCDQCGEQMTRLISAQIASVSYPDGTTSRFKAVKEQRELQKAMRQAKKSQDQGEVQYIQRKISDVRSGSKSDSQKANICKKKPQE